MTLLEKIIYLNKCTHEGGHIINAYGQCQWCHRDKETLLIESLRIEIMQLEEHRLGFLQKLTQSIKQKNSIADVLEIIKSEVFKAQVDNNRVRMLITKTF